MFSKNNILQKYIYEYIVYIYFIYIWNPDTLFGLATNNTYKS